MSSTIEKIKDRLNIVDVVSQYIKLEKAGNNLKAKCPFHNEKTPSFFVSPIRNSYYCFGCNASGDIFSFVENFEGVDFMGALKILGEKSGVPIVFEKKTVKDERFCLYNIMEEACLFFEKNLQSDSNNNIRKYLKKRGLDEETIKKWKVGYSASSWSGLYDYLKKTFVAADIEKAGLIKKSEEKNNNYYDRFRDRIMFPILDGSGRIIAFSGRIFKEDGKNAKYINSPETPLFSKSKILYGYDKAKFAIRKLNFSIIVEGQMDLLASHYVGFVNTVAASGTALSVEQLNLLRRLSNNIVMAFDSDSAGLASSGKSAMLALSLGMDVKVARLPFGEDPSSVILKDKNIWKDAIKNSKHIVDFYLAELFESIDDKRKLHLKIQQIVIPYIAKIPNKIDQAHFISITAARLGVSEDIVWEETYKILELENKNYDTNYNNIDSQNIFNKDKKRAFLLKRSSIEDKIASIINWQKNTDNPIIDIKSAINKLEIILGIKRAEYLINENKNIEKFIFESELIYMNHKDLREDLDDLLRHLEQEYLKEYMDKTLDELRLAEAEGDSDKISEALKKHKKISGELNK